MSTLNVKNLNVYEIFLKSVEIANTETRAGIVKIISKM